MFPIRTSLATFVMIGAALSAPKAVVFAQGNSDFGQGNPSTIVTATDLNLDGTPDIVLTRTFTYQSGRAVKTVLTIDGNAIIHADGVVDQVQTTTSTFGPHGDVLKDIVLIDANNDGTIDARRVVTYTYDGKGDLTRRLTESFNSANVKNSEDIQTNTYDARGNLLTQHWTFDFGFDGTINRVQDLTNMYDGQGRLIQTTAATDTNGDGTVDTRVVTTLQRDNNGLPILQTTTIDDPADGVIDEVRTTTAFEFHGRDIQDLAMSRDVAPLGSPEWSSFTTFTYDQRGNQIARAQAIDLGNDGTVDNTLHATTSYDKKGNVLQTYIEADTNLDGFADETITTTFTY